MFDAHRKHNGTWDRPRRLQAPNRRVRLDLSKELHEPRVSRCRDVVSETGQREVGQLVEVADPQGKSVRMKAEPIDVGGRPEQGGTHALRKDNSCAIAHDDVPATIY